MCSPNSEYHRVNPSTQVALFSSCIDNCTSLINITWTVYQGLKNLSDAVQWTPFLRMNSSQDEFFGELRFKDLLEIINKCFLGTNTSNFTATSKLFMDNINITYWRMEVVYYFDSETSSSALNFQINQLLENGSCIIDPLSGTTSTIFFFNCSGWNNTDNDGILKYSVYGKYFTL